MAGFSSTTCLLLIFLLLRSSEARDILVGGKADAWAIPSSESQSLNKWAETNRFRTGDTLGKLINNEFPSFGLAWLGSVLRLAAANFLNNIHFQCGSMTVQKTQSCL